MGILDGISKTIDIAQPIRGASRAVAQAVTSKVAAAAPPTENKGYTERLTGEKSTIGAASGAMKSINTNTGDFSKKSF
jgi:hypothetical protein